MNMKLEQKALYLNIIVNLFVSFIKIFSGVFWNAFTLLIDGIYTISDLVTDVIALFGIKIGRKRANKNHPYGYGRVFYVIELFMGVLAFLVGIFVIYLSFKIDYQKPPLGIIFLILGIVFFKLISARNLFWIGKKEKSELLVVSSLESKMEAFSTLGLIVIIILGQFIPKIDMIGGILIAILLIIQSVKIIKQNINFLIGNTYEDENIKEKVKKIVDKYKVINILDITLINDGPYYELILKIKAHRNIKVSHLLRAQNKIKKELKAKTWGIKFIEFHLV